MDSVDNVESVMGTAVAMLMTGAYEHLAGLLQQHPGLLADRGADGQTILHFLAAEGWGKAVLDALRYGANVADRTGEWVEDDVPEGGYYEPGMTALMLAAGSGSVETVRVLIEAGANVRVESMFGDTALHLVAVDGPVKIANLLLANGAAPEADCVRKRFTEERGWEYAGRPRHVAVTNGQRGIVRSLLGHGADINAPRVGEGFTLLILAVGEGDVEMVKLLVAAGADPDRFYAVGDLRNPLRGNALIAAVIEERFEIGRLLVAAGADVDRPTPDEDADSARDWGMEFDAERWGEVFG